MNKMSIDEYLTRLKADIVAEIQKVEQDLPQAIIDGDILDAYFNFAPHELSDNEYFYPLHEIQLPGYVSYDMAATDNMGNRFLYCYGFVIKYKKKKMKAGLNSVLFEGEITAKFFINKKSSWITLENVMEKDGASIHTSVNVWSDKDLVRKMFFKSFLGDRIRVVGSLARYDAALTIEAEHIKVLKALG